MSYSCLQRCVSNNKQCLTVAYRVSKVTCACLCKLQENLPVQIHIQLLQVQNAGHENTFQVLLIVTAPGASVLGWCRCLITFLTDFIDGTAD